VKKAVDDIEMNYDWLTEVLYHTVVHVPRYPSADSDPPFRFPSLDWA